MTKRGEVRGLSSLIFTLAQADAGDAMGSEKEFVSNVTRLDLPSFDLATGLRAGAFVVMPFLLAPVIGYVGAAFAALNGMWLTNTEGPDSGAPLKVLLVACLAESAATGLGTMAGSAGALTPLLVGLGVFFPMLLHGASRWDRVGTYTAITFAVGVGIPGDLHAAAVRAGFSLLGTLWVLFGIAAQRRLGGKTARGSGPPGQEPGSQLHPDAPKNALSVGAASAIGIAVGLALNLPRDFWVVVTIILSVQPSFNSTFIYTSGMVLGTIVGAVIGATAVAYAPGLYPQLLFLVAFAVFMFATRGVNTALMQVFLAPFVIVLLALIYGHQVNFAEARVLDVAIGGVISVATVYILGLDVVRSHWKRPAGVARD
ncbi:MAG: FUSC family protein [Nitrososphaerota archaeon]|nr:FUSC family protein [Nitrososphaerota archaeon]